jgi:hypothetical protein
VIDLTDTPHDAPVPCDVPARAVAPRFDERRPGGGSARTLDANDGGGAAPRVHADPEATSGDNDDGTHSSDGGGGDGGDADGDPNHRGPSARGVESDDDHGDDYDDGDDDYGDDKRSGSGGGDDSDEDEVRPTGRAPAMSLRVAPECSVPIDETLARRAREGSLTRADLDAVDATTALRLALVPEARPAVEAWWGAAPLRGLPLAAGPDPERPYALMAHQVRAVRWMRQRESLPPGAVHGLRGGIVCVKMGMGKTLMALAHVLTSPRGEFPTLVVCSKTVLHEWRRSGVEKFFAARSPGTGERLVRALYLHRDFIGADALRRVDRAALARYDIVLTTYDVCVTECRRGDYAETCLERQDADDLPEGVKGKVLAVHPRTREDADRPDLAGTGVIYGTPWERVVCDESQRFANPNTQTYRAMMAIYGRFKWCLTGTPVRNYHTDIWAQMRFLGYRTVSSKCQWVRDGPCLYARHRLGQAVLVMGYDELSSEEAAPPSAPVLSPSRPTSSRPGAAAAVAVARASSPGREANAPGDSDGGRPIPTEGAGRRPSPPMPPRYERDVIVTLSRRERTAYEVVLGLVRAALDAVLKKALDFACILALFTRLRQVADAAHLITLGTGAATKEQIMAALAEADERGDGDGDDDDGSHGSHGSRGGIAIARSALPRPPPSGPTGSAETVVFDGEGDGAQDDAEKEAAACAAADAREASMRLGRWCRDRTTRAGMRSAKMRAVVRILRAVPPDEKVLVFSTFASCLELVAETLADRLPGMGAIQIDGSTTGTERDERLRAFRDRQPGAPRVLLMTYKVGSEGLNLTEATHCVCVEPWWTNAVHEQAYARCWRMGQTRPVTIYNIIAADTIEERVTEVCREKTAIAEVYLGRSAPLRRAARRRADAGVGLDLATLTRILS